MATRIEINGLKRHRTLMAILLGEGHKPDKVGKILADLEGRAVPYHGLSVLVAARRMRIDDVRP